MVDSVKPAENVEIDLQTSAISDLLPETTTPAKQAGKSARARGNPEGCLLCDLGYMGYKGTRGNPKGCLLWDLDYMGYYQESEILLVFYLVLKVSLLS